MSEQNVQPARWLADPTGRHELRYWDGVRWTAHVSDRGAISVDDLSGPAGPGAATAVVPAAAAAAAGTAADGATVVLDDDAPTASFDPFADDEPADRSQVPVGAGVGAGLGAGLGAQAGGPGTTTLGSAVGYVVPGGIVAAGADPSASGSGIGTLFGPDDLRLDDAPAAYRGRPDPGLRNRMPLLVGGLVVCAVVGTITGIVAFSGLPDSGTDAARVVASPTVSTTAPEPEVVETPVVEATVPGPIISSALTQPTDPMGDPSLEPPELSPTPTVTKTPKPKPSATVTVKPTPTPMPPTEVKRYNSCQSMRQDYPHGVGLPGAVDRGSKRPVTDFVVDPRTYARNAWLDRDSDGIVCEPKG